jgi:hypothetical protein
MGDTDLDYGKFTGRLALTVGDGGDGGDNPDTIWCDSGTVTIRPLTSFVKVTGGAGGPFTAGQSSYVCTIDANGYVTFNGKPYVWVVDLTSTKVNPVIGPNKATHQITFQGVSAQGVPVALESTYVRITKDGPNGDGVNDLTNLAPVAVAGAQPIFRGEPGTSIAAVSIDGGNLVLELSDGTVLNAGEVPPGPGGSNDAVAGYLATAGPTKTAATAVVATQIDGVIAPLAARSFDRPMLDTRQFPGSSGIPATNAALGTITVGAANAASAITGSVLIAPSTALFRPIGIVPKYGTAFPDTLGWLASATYVKTSSPPWGFEFDFDTADGQFEFSTKGGGAFRVLVNGQYLGPAIALPNDGNGYLPKIALTGGAGTYRITVELTGASKFWGLRTIDSAGITPSTRRAQRYAILGDSTWEPTVSETGLDGSTLYGQPTILRQVTGLDIFAMGSGGTGLMNPGPAGRVKFRDRLGEVTSIPGLDGVIIAMTANDQAYTAAQVLAEAQAVVAELKASGLTRPGQIIVFGQWWSAGGPSIPGSVLAQNDAVKAWCANQGIPFVDILTPPGITNAATTLAAASAGGATSISTNALIVTGSWVKIGPPGTAALRKVTAHSGTGPYTLGFVGGLPAAYANGDPVLEVGESELTTANAARFTGPDTSHPTRAGAAHRVKRYVARLEAVLNR